MTYNLAKILKKFSKETANEGAIFLGTGNVAYRMQDLVKRRRNAVLSGQHKQAQRYDREVMILRSAMGLPIEPMKEDDPDIIDDSRNSKKGTTRDDVQGDDLETSSEKVVRDVDWAKRVTLKGFASIYKRLHEAGYSYASEEVGGVTHHTWQGFRNRQPEKVCLAMLGRSWLASASINGHRVDGFTFNKSEDAVQKGIPMQVTAAQWDGSLDAATKQKYALSWAKLLKEI